MSEYLVDHLAEHLQEAAEICRVQDDERIFLEIVCLSTGVMVRGYTSPSMGPRYLVTDAAPWKDVITKPVNPLLSVLSGVTLRLTRHCDRLTQPAGSRQQS